MLKSRIETGFKLSSMRETFTADLDLKAWRLYIASNGLMQLTNRPTANRSTGKSLLHFTVSLAESAETIR